MTTIDGKTYVARGGEVYESVAETMTDRGRLRAMLRRTRDLIDGINAEIAASLARKDLLVIRRDAIKVLVDASGGE